MNPLLIKFGLPAAILAAIAFMRWTNVKTSGEPFFPGVGDSSSASSSAGGLPDVTGPRSGVMTSAPEVQDSGTYYDPGEIGYDDVPEFSLDTDIDASPTFTQAPAGLSGSAQHAYQGAQEQNISTYSQPDAPSIGPSLQPYSPTPTTNTPHPLVGGGYGHGGVYAL